MDAAAADQLICASLRGEAPAWPDGDDAGSAGLLLQRARYHGVVALLNEAAPRLATWPEGVKAALHAQALAHAVWELRHQRLVADVLGALRVVGIEPVLFKGTALAYGLYANPVWRERGDTDMIVAPADAERAGAVLAGMGFERNPRLAGELVSYQDTYLVDDRQSGDHAIDLHWRINNSEVLSRLFTHAELRAAAVPLPALCPEALAADPVHALLLAGFHRAGHKQHPYYVDGIAHLGGDRLIWLHDIHVLARSFTAGQWQDLARLAIAKDLCAITREGLLLARACFGTDIPRDAAAALARTGEHVETYLGAGALRQGWMDLKAIEGIGRRLQFVGEIVFPPADYMRSKYPEAGRTWLPWLYARRATEGLRKRLGRRR